MTGHVNVYEVESEQNDDSIKGEERKHGSRLPSHFRAVF